MKVKDLFEVWKGGTFYVVPANFQVNIESDYTQVLFEPDINNIEFKAEERFKKAYDKRQKHLDKLATRTVKIFSSITYTIENEPQTLDELKELEIEAIKKESIGSRSDAVFVFVKDCKVIYT